MPPRKQSFQPVHGSVHAGYGLIHQLELAIFERPAQRILQMTVVPARCVNDHAEMRSATFEVGFVELPCFYGRIHQRIVAGRDE